MSARVKWQVKFVAADTGLSANQNVSTSPNCSASQNCWGPSWGPCMILQHLCVLCSSQTATTPPGSTVEKQEVLSFPATILPIVRDPLIQDTPHMSTAESRTTRRNIGRDLGREIGEEADRRGLNSWDLAWTLYGIGSYHGTDSKLLVTSQSCKFIKASAVCFPLESIAENVNF